MLTGILFQFFEAPVHDEFKSFPNTIWVVIVIITTIGFGDIYPLTLFGRIISILLSLISLFCIGVSINLILNMFNFTNTEDINYK